MFLDWNEAYNITAIILTAGAGVMVTMALVLVWCFIIDLIS